MNKTVKTIAWICLVLGLLGVAVDVGVYVRGRALVAQVQEAIEAGEFPAFKERFSDVDEDGDVDRDDLKENLRDRDGWPQIAGMMDKRRGFDHFSNSRGRLSGMQRGGFTLPLLFLASGPVLTVIGVVTLIVNREPKVSDSKAKKVSGKKK